jgi:uncharacterized protein (TIGR00255 family)
MTGYGVASADAPAARVTVEIRGVNQRFLDVKVTVPREYASWEREIRDRLRGVVHRGRVEVGVVRVPVAARRRWAVAVRTELARAYVGEARRLAGTLGLDGRVSLAEVLRLPDLFEVREEAGEPGRELPALRRALGASLRAFDAERRREGGHLRRDMGRRARWLRGCTRRMRRRLPHALRALGRRAEERLARAAGGLVLDPARVAQEVAVLAERSDVTEELVRLEGHLAALVRAVGERGPIGKRIEFLLQEVHRELNTLGAKAADRVLGDLALAAKAETEKLREQVQNVE